VSLLSCFRNCPPGDAALCAGVYFWLVRISSQAELGRTCGGGGWDSRALAGLMTRRGLDFATLTTYGDTGTLDDPECARLVADELQLVNTYIPLPPDYLARHWRDKCLATDFATTMHTWLWPLSQRHGFVGAVNMDGIAGDVALKGLMLRPEHLAMLGQRDDGALLSALWQHHGMGDALQRCLRPEVAAEWTERARASLSVSAPATSVNHRSVLPTKSVKRKFQGSSACTSSTVLAAGKSRSTRRSQV